jgi:hypothetical protein
MSNIDLVSTIIKSEICPNFLFHEEDFITIVSLPCAFCQNNEQDECFFNIQKVSDFLKKVICIEKKRHELKLKQRKEADDE